MTSYLSSFFKALSNSKFFLAISSPSTILKVELKYTLILCRNINSLPIAPRKWLLPLPGSPKDKIFSDLPIKSPSSNDGRT